MSDDEKRPPPAPAPADDAEVRARLKAMSRRGFALQGAAALGAIVGWRWLATVAAEDGGLAWPLRRALSANEALWRRLYSPQRLAPTFPASAVRPLRANGDVGLEDDAPGADHRVRLVGAAGGERQVDLAALKALPRTEMITEFKCIEGWSTVASFAGVRFADFARAFPPPTRSGRPFDPARPDDVAAYVSLSTPDDEYYVGLDAAAALHPQTLLAFELNGEPLSPAHGAPLRLVIPVKYGVKNIKRIGTIEWTDTRPDDYWAERGYDWYAAL